MKKKTIFTGSAVAIVTPFTKDGVDFEKLGELIEFQIENQTDAIVICGTTGESSTMPDDEHNAVIAYTVKKVAGRVPVIAGTGSNDTRHCIALSQEAQANGADALLLVTPYYNKCSQSGLVKHYSAVAEAVNIPIILYNVPSRTGVNIQPQTVAELAKVQNIVAIKEASGNISQVAKIAQLCGDTIDIYSGNDDQIIPVLSLGGKGVISVVANIAPKETHQVAQLYLDGWTKEACALQLKLFPLMEAMFSDVNPIPVKTALNLMGYNVGGFRLPLSDMSDSGSQKLAAILRDFGLLN